MKAFARAAAPSPETEIGHGLLRCAYFHLPKAPPLSALFLPYVCNGSEMEEAGSSVRDVPDTRTAYEKKWDEQVLPCRTPGRGVKGHARLYGWVVGTRCVHVHFLCVRASVCAYLRACGSVYKRGQIKKLEVKRAKESAKKTHRYLWWA